MPRVRALMKVTLLVTLLAAGILAAHPLGNNTTSRLAELRLGVEELQLRYVLDVAEIPALMAAQAADGNRDGATSAAEWTGYVAARLRAIETDLDLEIDGRRVDVRLRGPRWTLLEGAGGLATLRIEAQFRTTVAPSARRLRYHDRHEPAQAGWKDVIVTTVDEVRLLRSSAPREDPTAGLTTFPDAASADLPERVEALVEFAMPERAARAHARTGPAIEAATAPAVGSAGERPAAVDAIVAPAPQGADKAATPPAGRSDAAAVTTTATATGTDAPVVREGPWRLFLLGMHHIATGPDHLLFLLGLLLMLRELRTLIAVVTAFTLAHSATLALAASGRIVVPASIVEPAIALTVAYVGYVGFAAVREPRPVLLAFAFGLVHGLGFAGAVVEALGSPDGLPREWLLNLLSFNLGIEAFQLLMIAVLLPAAWLLRGRSWSGAGARTVSCAILLAGLGWFLARTLT